MISGSMSLLDQRLIKPIAPILVRGAFASSGNNKSKHNSNSKSLENAFRDFLTMVPFTVQGELKCFTSNEECWFILKPEYLATDPADLSLMYGASIPGRWHMLGIVDARPDHLQKTGNQEHTGLNQSSEMKQALSTMIDAIKEIIGRPQQCYGITPVMIFREVRN